MSTTPTLTPTLDQLTQPKPRPPEYQVLTQFNKSHVAQCLDVNTNYLCSVISGYKRPSYKLHCKIMELIRKVEAEKAMTANGENGGQI